MPTKYCPRCEQNLPVSEFTKNSSRKDGFCSYCKSCHREYTKAHYSQNKDYYKSKAKDHGNKVKAYIADLKRNTPCTDCGVVYPPHVMDFDHLEGKDFNVAQGFSYSFSAVRREIAKCEIVCSNCHRQRTYARRNNADLAFVGGRFLGKEE